MPTWEEQMQGQPSASTPAASDASSAPASPKIPTYEEEMQGASPKGVLSDKPIATTLVKTASHLPGMAGDIRDFLGSVTERAISSATGQSPEMTHAALQAIASRLPFSEAISKIPSGESIQQQLFKKGIPGMMPPLGQYIPETFVGKVAMGAGEAMTPGFGGKRKLIEEIPTVSQKALEIAKNYLTREAVPQAVSGAAATAVGESTGNPVLAWVSGLLGHKTGAVIPRAIESRFSPTRSSEIIAGNILRSSASDPDQVMQNLDPQNRPSLFPNMHATTDRVSQDPGISTLEQTLDKYGNSNPLPASAGAQHHTQKRNVDSANQVAYANGIDQIASSLDPDLKSHYGVSEGDVKGMSSEEGRAIFSSLEEEAANEEKNAWDKVGNAKIFANKTLQPVLDHISGLTKRDQLDVDPSTLSLISDVQGMGSQVPVREVQGIRSGLLSAARKAAKAGDYNAARVNNELAAVLFDGMSEPSNFPKFMGQDTAASANWQAAVDASKKYHSTFNVGFLKDLNKSTEGVDKINSDATFRALLRGDKATQNIKLIQNATDGKINPSLINYLVGDLTNNARATVTPSQVDSWLGKNSGIVDAIPGAKERIESIRDAATQHALHENLGKAKADPQKVFGLLSDPENSSFFKMLHPEQLDQLIGSTAHMVGTQPKASLPGEPLPIDKDSLLYKMQSGNAVNTLYGKTGAAFAGAGTGAMLYGLSKMGLEPYNLEAMLTLLGYSGTGGVIGSVPKTARGLLSGRVPDTVDAILQRARSNPDEALRLMRGVAPKPQGAVSQAFGMPAPTKPQMLEKLPRTIGIPGARGAIVGQEVAEEKEKESETNPGSTFEQSFYEGPNAGQQETQAEGSPTNNIGNILDQKTGKPIAYATPQEGAAAASRNLLRYPDTFNNGKPMTLLEIARHWAPKDDGVTPALRGNDPEKWAQAVSQYSKVGGVDKPINLSNKAVMAAVLRGIHAAEHGEKALYPTSFYSDAIGAGGSAFGEDAYGYDEHGNRYLKVPVTRGSEAYSSHAAGGRIQRARGGKVDLGAQERLVNKLMNMAKSAKKATDATTEPLLNAPDEAIVKALDVAQQAI
jgi:hypothetical protein